MGDKLNKAVDAIVKKTEEGKMDWERTDERMMRKNAFFRKYIDDNGIEFDGMNNYMAEYNQGYIYFSNQSGFREIAIQPNNNADITILETGLSSNLRKLEELIKDRLDNPDDFINSLFE